MIIEEKLKFKIESFNLYLNIIGGHSLFIEIDKNYLIKSSNESEINFYKFSSNKKFTPKFFGVIEKNSSFFNLISKYVHQLKLFFKYFLIKYKLSEDLINIENDEKFPSIFNSFILNEKNRLKDINELLPSFFLLEKKLLNLYEHNLNKLKWILFWFVKWNKNFLKNKFIIIENLTNKMIQPAIIDIKLGNSPKINKESNKIKIFKGAINEIGCRIMGFQKENIFLNKYDTKNFSLKRFKEILNIFFYKKDLIQMILFKIGKIIDEIRSNIKININFSSLLIIYDENDINSKILLNLIDFSFIEDNIYNNNKNINNLIEPIKNFMNILKELENFNEIKFEIKSNCLEKIQKNFYFN